MIKIKSIILWLIALPYSSYTMLKELVAYNPSQAHPTALVTSFGWEIENEVAHTLIEERYKKALFAFLPSLHNDQSKKVTFDDTLIVKSYEIESYQDACGKLITPQLAKKAQRGKDKTRFLYTVARKRDVDGEIASISLSENAREYIASKFQKRALRKQYQRFDLSIETHGEFCRELIKRCTGTALTYENMHELVELTQEAIVLRDKVQCLMASEQWIKILREKARIKHVPEKLHSQLISIDNSIMQLACIFDNLTNQDSTS